MKRCLKYYHKGKLKKKRTKENELWIFKFNILRYL